MEFRRYCHSKSDDEYYKEYNKIFKSYDDDYEDQYNSIFSQVGAIFSFHWF